LRLVLKHLGGFGLVDFPDMTQGTSLPGNLYANPHEASIYSSHIHKLVEHCVFSVLRIPARALRSRGRAAPISLGRQMAMYLAHVAFRLSFTQVGQLFGRDRTTVAHACGVIEDLRDDQILDRALAVLAAALTAPCGTDLRERYPTFGAPTNNVNHDVTKK
jgi:Bacterial dnaA protein helix-turn-helix